MATSPAHVLRADDLIRPGQQTRTAKFEGADYEAGASFFYVNNQPGQGVGLHWHPYSETWIVVEGEVTFRVGDARGDSVDTEFSYATGTVGTIATIPPEVHHGFENTGSGTLRMVCIHANDRIIQFELE
ncbi:MAG: cupin domain-containing protein [Pseudolysinimonas sp.]